MSDKQRGHTKDRENTATLQAGRDLTQLQKECAEQAKDAAKAAKEHGGNPARMVELQRHQELLRRELDKRANAAAGPEQRRDIDHARAAVRTLEEQQASELRKTAEAAAKAYESMARSIERVEAAQRQSTETLSQRPAAAADVQRIADHQARQTRDLQESVSRQQAALRDHESLQANAIRETNRQLTEATLANRSQADAQLSRTDLINKVLSDANRHAQEREADLQGMLRNFESERRAIEERVSPEQREGLKKELDHEALRELDNPAIDRLVAAALEGRQQRDQLDADSAKRAETAAADRVKGQLLEEAFRAQAQAEARELSAKLGRDVQLIEGHRIRDEAGKKLADGLLAWKDQADRLHVVRAYEAKAGEQAARRLNEEVAKLTGNELQEAQKYAEDLALERYGKEHGDQQNLRFANATAEQLETLNRYKQEELEKLKSRDARRDLGQKERTIERLHESTERATRIYIDGKPRTLAVDQGRTDVKAVLPENVRKQSEREALRANIRAEDLKKAAERFLDRLKRDGVWR